ncbi:MAG: DUF169 domain-containing protein, partial [Oscillospiraceae bacterium]|nr:DUF169 domain-containing protein [Oscillospiraceae bacterium]
PIGVKFSFFRPEDIPQLGLDEKLSLCEMLRKAQLDNEAFYFSKENTETCVAKIFLGMEEMTPFAESGQIGQCLGVFEEARCNQNYYQYITMLDRGTVNYVSFCPADKLTFEPDVLVISARPNVAEIVMRAMTYATGELFESKSSAVMGCTWLLLYPYKTQKVNFMLPAFVHGPHGRELYSEDTVLIGIPYRWIPTILTSLDKMDIHLTSHASREAYLNEFADILADLGAKAENP